MGTIFLFNGKPIKMPFDDIILVPNKKPDMDILQQIQIKVNELRTEGCDEKNIMIGISPLYHNLLIAEMGKVATFAGKGEVISKDAKITFSNIVELFGIKTFTKHPYNEILIYDSENVHLHQHLMRRIVL